jgi:predicted metalloprotease with PDZ domain
MIIRLLLITALLGTWPAWSQSLQYHFAAPNAVHHEAIIQLTARQLPAGPALFRMSRSSPGRYATHEFGKNIYNLKAIDTAGNPLPLKRIGADEYEISGHSGTVKLQYTLYANHADGTYALVDPAGLHLNMPACFGWIKGLENAPITLRFALPDSSWQIATQLFATTDRFTFTAPNLQYFMDAPVKAGTLRFRSWQVNNPDGTQQEIRIAFDTEATDAQLNAFTEKVKKITSEAAAVFGEYPAFETGRYTFLASLNPYVQGDGMEHRNSTMITMPVPPGMIDYALGTFAHEFFHAWNVERIRPASLEPFSFEKSNVSEALWVAEGFTQYYGSLLETRAALQDEKGWLASLAACINAKQHRPGGRHYNVIENSQHAVFSDAGVSIDRTNTDNIFSSYYMTGAAMALAMDLDLHNLFGKSLDDFMRALWLQHGKTGIPYTMQDLQDVLAVVSGDTAYAAAFFRDYVYSNQLFDYSTALQPAGIMLRPREPGKAWLGPNRLEEREGGLMVSGNTIAGTPLYLGGIDRGDILLRADETNLSTEDVLNGWLNQKRPGNKVRLHFSHRGQEKWAEVTLQASPDILLEKMPSPNENQRSLLTQWLGPRSR